MYIRSIIFAAIPFLVFIFLLFNKKAKLVWVSFITLILVVIFSLINWKIKIPLLVGSLEKGFFVSLDIFFIILGALFFLEIVKANKIIENIGYYLRLISEDLRIQVILLAWFFENFLEGTAGFGTPSTVVAPFLVSLGISPLNAVVTALLGNSTSVVFGAAGAPIKVGFGSLAGASLPLKAALFNCVGILVPVFMLWFLVRDKENSRKHFLEALPFALFSGFSFVVPSILSLYVGQEFPSILGSVVGLAIALGAIKLKIFLPPKREVFQVKESTLESKLPLRKVLFPYLFLILLLIAGKFIIGSSGISVPIAVKHTFSFFNPGFAFVIAGITLLIIYKSGFYFFKETLGNAFKKSLEPFLVIAFMSSMAQIMVNSSQNTSGIMSMVDFLAINFKNLLLPIWSPFIGAFGSFLTGSATVSNLMFGNFLSTTAVDLGLNTDGILALAVVGGAAGNMIALADMLAAETVVGLKNEEKGIIKKVILPCLIYVIFVGIVGMVALNNF